MNFDLQQPDAKDSRSAQRNSKDFEGDCSHDVIGAAIEVQKVLGVGLLESAYAAALAIELQQRGLRFQREVAISGQYKGVDVGVLYRADFVVDDSVVVEIKAVEGSPESHRAQLISYLRLSGHKVGLLINFHAFPLAKGIQRLVNKL